MNFEELDQDELQVFADLVVQMMKADGEISFDELQELEALVDELGEGLRAALESAQKKTREEALAGAAGVVEQTTRDLILTMLYDMAATDGLDDSEKAFLDTVKKKWTFDW